MIKTPLFGNFPYSLDCVSESFDLAVSIACQEIQGAYRGGQFISPSPVMQVAPTQLVNEGRTFYSPCEEAHS